MVVTPVQTVMDAGRVPTPSEARCDHLSDTARQPFRSDEQNGRSARFLDQSEDILTLRSGGYVAEREDLLTAVIRRTRTGPEGSSGYLDPNAVIEAAQLAQILRDNGGTAAEWQHLGALHWLRHEHPEGGLPHDLLNAVLAYTPCFVEGVGDPPEALLPQLADQAEDAAFALAQSCVAVAGGSELSEAVRLWERIVAVTPAGHPDRIMRLNTLGGLLQVRAERAEPGQAGSQEDFGRAVVLLHEALSATAPDDPQRAVILNNLGATFLVGFEQSGSHSDLDLAVKALRLAVATPAPAARQTSALINLTDALQARVRLRDDPRDLDDAIRYGQAALDRLEPDAADRGRRLANLGISLYKRYGRSGARADLDAAAQALRTAAGGPGVDHYSDHLSAVLCQVFSLTGAPSDLDAAIDALRAAARRTRTGEDSPADRARRAEHLRLLGEGLTNRFDLGGARDDIDAAVRAFEESLALATDPSSADIAAGAAFGLATALGTRYEQRGSLADLNTAISLFEEGVASLPQGHPWRFMYLSNAGGLLESRFGRLGETADLDRGIDLHRQAVALLSPGDADLPAALNNLGTALRVRFRRQGRTADLDEAIDRLGQAAATGVGTVKGQALHNLATALGARFNRTGDVADIDAAIETARQATVLADTLRRPTTMSTLGQLLLDRFQHLGAMEDLDTAIEKSIEAVDGIPVDHADRPRFLNHLGMLFEARFERLRRLSDADTSIAYGTQAVEGTPEDHFERAGYLLCLGNVLVKRHLVSEDDSDAVKAVKVAREALRLTPEDSTERAAVLNLLCGALTHRFRGSRERADLDEAVEAAHTAVESVPPGHYGLTGYLNTLADALCSRFEHFGAERDAAEAMTVFERAVNDPHAAPSLRVGVARVGARRLAHHFPGRAADLLTAAVRLLPEVAPRRLKRLQQQERMGAFVFLASEAAALILADPSRPPDERATRALETLEAGRGVLLSQTLETRSDLTELRGAHPELAARFEDLREQADSPEPDDERQRPTAEFGALLRHIRTLPGFTSFGLPPTAEQLLHEAAHGPVVTINVDSRRADALLLTSEGIRSIELPALTFDTLAEQVQGFHAALEEVLHGDTSREDQAAATARLDAVLAWLWDVVAAPVLDALWPASAAVPVPLPRVWWVSSGLLNLVPLHAAGHHSQDGNGRTVMDRVVSSYTPTIRALGYARTRPTSASPTDRSLIVAMATTPDLPGGDLPHATIEAAKVARHVPASTTLSEAATADGPPTAETVLTHLADCAFAHFACHGHTNSDDPSQSRLLLHDHHERPFTVASLTATTLHNAQLAYLSACETAVGHGLMLLDESIHLAGAFQLAGFPHVIGTLWAVSDAYSSNIAEAFYTGLTDPRDGTPRTSEAARALHAVIRSARDKRPHMASRWAAYLHTGA